MNDKKPPREVLTVRVTKAGVAALDRIAAARTAAAPIDPVTKQRTRVTRSDVHREALREYVNRHDPQRRTT